MAYAQNKLSAPSCACGGDVSGVAHACFLQLGETHGVDGIFFLERRNKNERTAKTRQVNQTTHYCEVISD